MADEIERQKRFRLRQRVEKIIRRIERMKLLSGHRHMDAWGAKVV